MRLPIALGTALLFASPAAADPRIDLDGLPHREGALERLPTERLARWEPDAFLESIVVRARGDMLIADAITHDIYRVTPQGDVATFHHSDIKPMGLAIDIDDTVIATGRDASDAWHIFVFAPDGTLAQEIAVPEASALNGATFLAPGIVLANDADIGRIFRIDLATGTVSEWLRHDLLLPDPARSDLIPGINGIKIWNGAAYVSNTSQLTMLRVPLTGENFVAGSPEVIHEGLIIDDFAMGQDGSIYATTHIFDTVIRIEPDGSVTRIATAEDGVAGSTALAFGRTAADRNHVYVAADGGFYLDPDINAPAFLTRIDTGEPGLTLAGGFSHVSHPGQIVPSEAALVICYTAANSEAQRAAAVSRYTRFLELNNARILYAGQVFNNGRDAPPDERHYVIDRPEDQALAMMQGSPYAVEGVYSGCAAAPYTPMLGRLLGGVAWEDAVSDDQTGSR